jgi:hypothetical protein
MSATPNKNIMVGILSVMWPMKLFSIALLFWVSAVSANGQNCPEYIAPEEAKVTCLEKTGHVCHFELPAKLSGEAINFISVSGFKKIENDELTFYFTPSFHFESNKAKGVFSAKGNWDSITFEVSYSQQFCGPFFSQNIKLSQ